MISVLMGVYYHKETLALLERSVESILAQTVSDLELLICDDGSRDEARRYLEQMAERDGRIRLVRPGACFSLPEKLNACLRAAKGEWIARMDDDDYAHPLRFEKQLAYLRLHPEILFLGTNVNLIRGGEFVGKRCLPSYPSVRDFYMTQPFIHPTLMFHREILEAVNGYSESNHCVLCEDYDLLLRLYTAGYRGANLQECLLDYTLPLKEKGKRTMKHRWNEVVTRYIRFRELELLPKALPWVIKPVIVGLLPEKLLGYLKRRKEGRGHV